MQTGLKVNIAFSGVKTIVGWLQRATWNKRYRVQVKRVVLIQNSFKLKFKKMLLWSVKKMFLFEKIDENVQFNSLFLGNSWNFGVRVRQGVFLTEDWKCYPSEEVSSLQFFALEMRERTACRKETGSNVSVFLNKVSALEHDRFKEVQSTLPRAVICKYLSLSHKPDYERSGFNTYQNVSLFQWFK